MQELDRLDPGAGRLFNVLDPGKWEKVIYYRSPEFIFNGEPYEQANWICWGDSQNLKLADMVRRGFQPLEQFGKIASSEDPWRAILSHPRGPALFPLDQILAYRWYRLEALRHDWPSIPAGMTPGRLFPQLREAQVTEFGCPNCRNRVFLEPRGLFQHMHVHHNYKPEDIFAWGKQMGVDFSDKLKERAVRTLTFEAGPEPEVEPEPEVAVTTIGGDPERVKKVRGQSPQTGRMEWRAPELEEVTA